MGKDWDYHHAKLLSVQECWRSHGQDRRRSCLGQRELCHCLHLATVKNSTGIPEDCKRLVREILQLVRRSRSSPARIIDSGGHLVADAKDMYLRCSLTPPQTVLDELEHDQVLGLSFR